jgi:hypothetical protein
VGNAAFVADIPASAEICAGPDAQGPAPCPYAVASDEIVTIPNATVRGVAP